MGGRRAPRSCDRRSFPDERAGDGRPQPAPLGGAHSRRSGAGMPNQGTRRQVADFRSSVDGHRTNGWGAGHLRKTQDRSSVGGLGTNGLGPGIFGKDPDPRRFIRRRAQDERNAASWDEPCTSRSLDGQRRLDPAPASRLLPDNKMDPGLRRDDGEVVWGASDFGPGDQGLNGSRGIGRVAAAMPGGIAVHPSTGSGRTDRGPGTSRKDTDYRQFTLRRVQDERIRDRASPGKTKTIGRSPIDGLGTSESGTGHLEERPRLPTVHPSTGSGRMDPGLRISQTITNHRYRLFLDGPGTNRSRAECFQERLEPPIAVRPEPVEG